jgi:hypothetical protein
LLPSIQIVEAGNRVPSIAILIVPEIQNRIIMEAGYVYSFLRDNPV